MENCIFCKIAAHEIPSKVAYEDEEIIAFHDVNPVAPTHILMIPKRHIGGIAHLSEADAGVVAKIALLAKRLADEAGISEGGYRLVANQGEAAGQSVPHLHFHLLGGRNLGWPPG